MTTISFTLNTEEVPPLRGSFNPNTLGDLDKNKFSIHFDSTTGVHRPLIEDS